MKRVSKLEEREAHDGGTPEVLWNGRLMFQDWIVLLWW